MALDGREADGPCQSAGSGQRGRTGLVNDVTPHAMPRSAKSAAADSEELEPAYPRVGRVWVLAGTGGG
jgi:hypothetical protein